MNKEEKLKIEQECLLKYSKAKMIEKYINTLEENKQLKEFTNKVKQAFEYMRNCDPYEWESCEAYTIAYEMVFGDGNE